MIEVVCGSMFSGKTEELIRRIRRAEYAKMKTQVFKPRIDDRFTLTHVQSHNETKQPCQHIQSSSEILQLLDSDTKVVGIDEAQFLDLGVVDVCNLLAAQKIRVIVAGLDMDFKGLPFGPMPTLLAIADDITKLRAVCVVCGQSASRSQRLSLSDNLVEVGASESYEARCRHCHDPGLMLARHQPTLPFKADQNLGSL